MLGSEKGEEPSAAEEKFDLLFVVEDESSSEIQDCLCIVQSTDKALKVKDFVASALGYNPKYMVWFDNDGEKIDFKKSWKDIYIEDQRVLVDGYKGGDMQCAIQVVLVVCDNRNDKEVSPEDADKIINYLGEKDRTALERAWAGDASNEWRDLLTEKMTLLGLKKWNEKAKPTERPSILPNAPKGIPCEGWKERQADTLHKMAERNEEKDQEDKKKDIKDKQDKKDKKDKRDKKKDKKHKKDKKDKEDKKDKKKDKKDKKNKKDADKEEDKKEK